MSLPKIKLKYMIWFIPPPTFHLRGGHPPPLGLAFRAGARFSAETERCRFLCVLFRRSTIRATIVFELFRPSPMRGGGRGLFAATWRTERGLAIFSLQPFGFENGVAGKWRRNGLKRLYPRREMVWPRRPRTYKIWYTGARLSPAQEPRERQSCKVAEKGAQRFEIARCRTEIGACAPPIRTLRETPHSLPKALLADKGAHYDDDAPIYPNASSSPIMRSISESPMPQKPGSRASRPNGWSSSEYGLEPPAASSAR